MYAKRFSLIELNMTKTESEVQEIYDSLQEKPEKHTFILIKNMLGASKTLDDEFIGSVHETHLQRKITLQKFRTSRGDCVVGRRKEGKDGVKIFCDRFIIERYVELYSSQFDYEKEEFEWSDVV